MRSATYHSSSYRAQLSPRGRLAVLALAAAAGLLLILVLLRMGALPLSFGEGDGRPLSFEFLPAAQERAAAARRPRAAPPAARRAPAARAAERAPPPSPVRAPTPRVVWPEGFIHLSRADFAATDVGRIAAAPDHGGGAQAGTDDGPPAAPGSGPNGEKLYYAEWQREPTRAEMVTYLPKVEQGWGMIACRTAPRFRVEDCQLLGETPGSGIARGMREAAWQFLVRPPRLGGKPMIGAWVRIRFDIARGVEK